MDSQAKFQGLKHVPKVKSAQASVACGRHQKRKGSESLAHQKMAAKHLKPMETQSTTLDDYVECWAAGEFADLSKGPREILKAKLKETQCNNNV